MVENFGPILTVKYNPTFVFYRVMFFSVNFSIIMRTCGKHCRVIVQPRYILIRRTDALSESYSR